jgi:hypothetical protein
MLSDNEIKQIFFYCDKHEKDAVIADEVDIIQFAHKIEAVVQIEAARREHQRCVSIVHDLNRDVAKALNNAGHGH